MFRKIELRNFSTMDEKYQIMLLSYARRIIDKNTLGACFEEIFSLTEKLLESKDSGLRFLASELKLLISESELIRFF
ncbi:MAG: hypothetical protein QXG39_09200 [Candidatus Aenigmatarchaeota archaeon]